MKRVTVKSGRYSKLKPLIQYFMCKKCKTWNTESKHECKRRSVVNGKS